MAEGSGLHGQHEAPGLSDYAFFARAAPQLAGPERLRGLMLVARAAGWWWPFRGAAICTERPRCAAP
jgi:hypothetical protein